VAKLGKSVLVQKPQTGMGTNTYISHADKVRMDSYFTQDFTLAWLTFVSQFLVD